MVYRWARQAGLQPSDAADAVQDVFRDVIRAIDRFQWDVPGASFRGWLWTIARNQIRLYFRRLSGRPRAVGGSDANRRLQQQPDLLESDSEPEFANTRKRLVHTALALIRNDFSPTTWQAFWRLTVEGHSAAEIAADLGLNPATVRQAKYRVLCRLRQEIESN